MSSGVSSVAWPNMMPWSPAPSSFFSPESTPWATLEACLRATLGPRLRDLVLFDRYAGPGLEAGSRSLAIGLILQDVSHTLTDLDADKAVSEAIGALGRECGAKLRG